MSGLVRISTPEPSEVIRVFPIRTSFTPNDEFAFVGHPPLFRPGTRKTPVHVSVTFSWTVDLAEKIAASWRDHYDEVRIGGPAYGDYGDEFVPGKYLKQGCTITSRGCVKHCGWCPERNRPLRELPIKPGWIIQDSNLLACSETHIRSVFEMLREQKRAVSFPGGLDKHFLRKWHRELFDSISIHEMWFACDLNDAKELDWLKRTADILDGIPLRKRRCYTMIGYDSDDLNQSEKRIEQVFELGFMPFCQLYRPDEGVKYYSEEWRKVQRKWSRPAAYMSQVSKGITQ